MVVTIELKDVRRDPSADRSTKTWLRHSVVVLIPCSGSIGLHKWYQRADFGLQGLDMESMKFCLQNQQKIVHACSGVNPTDSTFMLSMTIASNALQ
jgi:hypothetical protein